MNTVHIAQYSRGKNWKDERSYPNEVRCLFSIPNKSLHQIPTLTHWSHLTNLSVTAFADDWSAIHHPPITGGPPISPINDALGSCGQSRISLHIISIPEVLPGAKVYLHCHNNTIVQMGSMKIWNEIGEGWNPVWYAWFCKGRSRLSSLVYRTQGEINHNADKCTFLSNLGACNDFMWFLVTGCSFRCNYVQQTLFWEINNSQ